MKKGEEKKGKKVIIIKFTECEKTFTKKESLTRHMRLHNDDKPYVCEEQGCEKSFPRHESLLTHIMSKHR